MPTFPKTRWLLVLSLPALLTPMPYGQFLAKVTPQESGLSSSALQQIDVLLAQAVERKHVAGAVALLARDGKVCYLRAKGSQDDEAALPLHEQDQKNKIPLGSQPFDDTEERTNQLPEYRGWTHVKSVLTGPKSKAFATEGGIHHIYANEKALAGLKTGQFQDGSVLIYDLLEVKEKDGMTIEGPRRRTDVMVKDEAHHRDSGGWDFRQFLGTDRRSAKLTPKQRANCFECHNRQKDRGFVFSEFRE